MTTSSPRCPIDGQGAGLSSPPSSSSPPSKSCRTPTTRIGVKPDSLRGPTTPTTTTLTTPLPTPVPRPYSSRHLDRPGAAPTLPPKSQVTSTFTPDIVMIGMVGHSRVLILTSYPRLRDVRPPQRRTARQTMGYTRVSVAGVAAPQAGSFEASPPHPDVTLPHFQRPHPSSNSASLNERPWPANVFKPPLKPTFSTPFQPIFSASRT